MDYSCLFQFLKFLQPDNYPVCFSFGIDDKPKDAKPYSKFFNNNNNSIKDFISYASLRQDEYKDGVFIAVNESDGKGRKKENIIGVNALYAELDYSSDNRSEMISKLMALDIPPNMIVASKNGPHTYWVVSDIDLNEFESYQHGLYGYLHDNGFTPDPKSINISRLLRVPGFYHLKNPNDPFKINLVHCSNIKYKKDELNHFLGYEYKKVCIKNRQKGQLKEKDITISNTTNLYYNNYINNKYNIINIDIKLNKDNKYISFIRNNKNYIKYEDFIKFINTIDLREILEFNKSTQCFFHNDKQASASYYQSPSGDWLYTCHSSNCDADTMNNIHLLAKLCHTTPQQIVKTLKVKLNVITSVEHINNAQKRTEFNLKALEEVKGSSTYKNINKLFKAYWNDITNVVQYQSDKACSSEFIYRDKPLAFLSNRYLGKLNGKDKNSANRLFNMLAVVGFIVKVREESLPEYVLLNAKILQSNMTARANGKRMNVISFYAMPVYTDELLAQIESMCGRLINQGITVSGISGKSIEEAVNIETAMKAYKIIRVIKPQEIKEEWLYEDDGLEEFLEEIHWIDPLEEYVASLFNRGSPMEVYEMSCLKNERML